MNKTEHAVQSYAAGWHYSGSNAKNEDPKQWNVVAEHLKNAKEF